MKSINELVDLAKRGYLNRDRDMTVINRNLDFYAADVGKSDYIEQYSGRELSEDYTDRLATAEKHYFNWPKKIFKIFQNAIFRFPQSIRDTDNAKLKKFMNNVTGNGMSLQEFTKDYVFLYNQLAGGVAVEVDRADPGQNAASENLPFVNLYPWGDIAYFELTRLDEISLIILSFEEEQRANEDGKTETIVWYKAWDKQNWVIFNDKGETRSAGAHNLGRVPVVLAYADRDPRDLRRPLTVFSDIVRIAWDILTKKTILERNFIFHVFLKLVMPESMYKAMTNGEFEHSETNAFVIKDGSTTYPSYIDMPTSEINELAKEIYDRLPYMILEMATIRDKTDRPREESGTAKFMDSTDEISTLLEKAERMEWAEREIMKIAALWMGIPYSEDLFTIEYSKEFDITSTNDLIEQVVKVNGMLDGRSPEFSREMLKRLVKRMLANAKGKVRDAILASIDANPDPSISIADVLQLIDRNLIYFEPYFKMLNPELKDKSTAEIREFMQGQADTMRGMSGRELILDNEEVE